MLVRTFGLFWERDEVDWSPGHGGNFRLLGRQGKNLPNLRMADFRDQVGIYVLYSDYGPYYVGITIEMGLGRRLKNHCSNDHADGWRRFSWFGFRDVEKARKHEIYDDLRTYKRNAKVDTSVMIEDIEALLIKTMGPRHQNDMNFHDAEPWEQVRSDELDAFEAKLKRHKGLELPSREGPPRNQVQAPTTAQFQALRCSPHDALATTARNPCSEIGSAPAVVSIVSSRS